MRTHLLILVLILLCSCGGDSAEAIRDDFELAVVEFSDALDDIVDESSARDSKGDLARFRSQIREIERREAGLSSGERQKLLQMRSGMERKFMGVFQPAMQRILLDPALARHLTATMVELAGRSN